MQIVRLLFAGIAVIFGLLVALVVAVAGTLIFLISRLFGRSTAKARFNVNFQRTRPSAHPAAAPRAQRIDQEGVIDVEATEIKH